ncbi:hypothetical protein [Agromyces bauzanensis]
MDDQRVATGEASERPERVASPARGAVASAGAVLVSLGVVISLLVSFIIMLNGEAQYAFHGMDSSANLRNAIVVMSVAVGIPLAVLVAWVIRHLYLMSKGRRRRWGALVTAFVCLVLGLTSISVVTGATKRVERDAAMSFAESLDATAIEAQGVVHLEWMARSLELNVVGEPEITRESCVLADGSRGVAPTVVLRAETGRVAAEDLVRVAMVFWRGDGYDPHEGAGGMAYVSGTALEDPYVEILVIPDVPSSGLHELSYHAVCMKPAS